MPDRTVIAELRREKKNLYDQVIGLQADYQILQVKYESMQREHY